MTVPGLSALRSPVTQFVLTGLATLAVLVLLTGYLGGRAARDEALVDARATTSVLAHSVAEPEMRRGLVAGDAGAVDQFDRMVLDRLVVGDVRRIKIWDRDGRIIYSDEARLIGERFALDGEELEVLDEGGTEAEVSDLAEPENRFEAGDQGLVEVYTRIESPEGEPLLFEAYFSSRDIEARRSEVLAPFREITVGALLVLVAVATSMLWVLTRRLTRAGLERERLLRSAATASDAERRRVARDLHDGVVQDLAGTTFGVAALARELPPPQRERLDEAAGSLRTSLRALRSLLVEIHPPGLTAEGLPSALDDLTAPAAAEGVDVQVHVSPLGDVHPDVVALVWRVAQEAVRNTLRHAHADHLRVSVQSEGDSIVLEVADDGQGFDPDQPRPGTHYGLRGLESLVRDTGGTLDVSSSPGAGARVVVRVPR
ncbi:sensor histidine kinase [Nocardioides sp. 503]|uniref:sensor histidine kinase n=1 Tax=Nocardioides sp. 503 TaxID=2508326 RepID=UPI00106F84EE|nr:sensor histidine kinase [Nocardioides sp. 503]